MLIRRFLAGLLVSLLAFAPAAEGATSAQRVVVLSGIQSWSLPGSSADLYFALNAGSCAINRLAKPCTSLLSTTRASTGYAQWADGHYSSFGNNVPRITDQGLLVEQAGTNIALWNRDLTNANWTKSNATVALDQVGIDGVANSASSVLATANNATVTAAAITSASASRTQGWFIQRITGSGAISVSQDGGSTFIAVTTKVGATWYRASSTDFSGLTQTVTNPQLVIKLGTSGDKIAIDFVDLEAGGFCTSPILTTTGSATRAADVITLAGAAQTAALAAKAAYFQTNLLPAGAVSPRLAQSNASGVMQIGSTTSLTIASGANSASATFGSGTTAGLVKSAFGFDGSSMTAIGNGGTKGTNANSFDLNSAPIYLGNRSSGDRALNGFMRRAAFSPIKGQFDAFTTASALDIPRHFAANDNAQLPMDAIEHWRIAA